VSLEARVTKLEQEESKTGGYEYNVRAVLRNLAKGQEVDESVVQLLLPHEKLLGPEIDSNGQGTLHGLEILIDILKQ
jgi:hypothetical protein